MYRAKYHPLSRPARCEAEAVDRLLHLAAMAGDAPLYIVHLSSKEADGGYESAGIPPEEFCSGDLYAISDSHG